MDEPDGNSKPAAQVYRGIATSTDIHSIRFPGKPDHKLLSRHHDPKRGIWLAGVADYNGRCSGIVQNLWNKMKARRIVLVMQGPHR